MPRPFLLLAAGACVLAGCQSTPKQTVLDLDTTDPKWLSAECVSARKAVAKYDDKELVRTAAGVAGTVAAGPIAGAAASSSLSAAQDDEREDLNAKVKRACVSKPGEAAPAATATAAAPAPADAATDASATTIADPAPLAVPPPPGEGEPADPAEPGPQRQGP